jgi:hypothetical protein
VQRLKKPRKVRRRQIANPWISSGFLSITRQRQENCCATNRSKKLPASHVLSQPSAGHILRINPAIGRAGWDFDVGPLRVKRRHLPTTEPGLLHPQETDIGDGRCDVRFVPKRTRAGQQRQLYSITSSARSNRLAGSSNPIILAVFKLIVK